MTTKQRHYIETSAVLAFLKGEPERFDQTTALLQQAEEGRIELFTSAFTIAEVVKGAEVGLQAEETIRDFFEHSRITVIQVRREVGLRARQVALVTGLKPPDAVHLATALEYGATHLATYDLKCFGKAVPHYPHISIGHPAPEPAQLTLDLPGTQTALAEHPVEEGSDTQ